VVSNDVFIAAMRSCGKVRVLVSEEEEKAIEFAEHPDARYAVVCDPIDGSSNLDAGVSVGTIFGIYALPDKEANGHDTAAGTPEALLCRPGSELVASGFTMYGASAMLVITMKGGDVNGFTLDNALGEFILTHPRMQIPRRRSIYSCNEGNSVYWEAPVKDWVEGLKSPGDANGKPYSARYIGSMVADAYRTLLYGGIFAYPADKKSPKGKLRILYECAPMALVFENGTSLRLHRSLSDRSQREDRPSTRTCSACSTSCRSTYTTGRGFSWAATTRCSGSSTCTRSTQRRLCRRQRRSQRPRSLGSQFWIGYDCMLEDQAGFDITFCGSLADVIWLICGGFESQNGRFGPQK
jgi:fructose-1,6-bisphosphatase